MTTPITISPTAVPQANMLVVTVVEARWGRGPRPAFRFLGLTGVSPEEAITNVSAQLKVPFKEIRELSQKDGYLYAIPREDGKATQVRAKRCPVGRKVPVAPRPTPSSSPVKTKA